MLNIYSILSFCEMKVKMKESKMLGTNFHLKHSVQLIMKKWFDK